MRNLHDCTQCAQIREQLPSEGSTQPLEDDCEILRPMCFTLSVTLQSSILFFTRAARHYISSFLLSAIQEMNPSNDHSTCTQMTLKHKTDRHADSNIDSPFTISCLPRDHHPPPNPSFLGNVQQFQIRLSHQFLPVKGKRIKKKKRGGAKKSSENDDFSLLKLGPVVCNLLRHSTSSASLFNNFARRGT